MIVAHRRPLACVRRALMGAALATATTATAQTATPSKAPPTRVAPVRSALTIEQIDVRALPLTSVRFTAGTRGRYLGGMLARDLRVLVNGARVDSMVLRSSGAPSDSSTVVLVLDLTRGGPTALRDVREVLAEFTERMRPSDRVAVLGVQDSTYLLLDLSTRDRAPTTIRERVFSTGGPVLWDGVRAAVDIAAASGAPRRYVVAVSTAPATDTVLSVREVSARALSLGVPVFTVAVARGADTASLRTLAAETGGRSYLSLQGSGTRSAYAAIASQIESEYLLTFAVPEGALEKAVQFDLAVVSPYEDWRPEELRATRTFLATLGLGIDAASLRRSASASPAAVPEGVLLTIAGVTVVLSLAVLVTLFLPQGRRPRVILAAIALVGAITTFVMALLSSLE